MILECSGMIHLFRKWFISFFNKWNSAYPIAYIVLDLKYGFTSHPCLLGYPVIPKSRQNELTTPVSVSL